LDGAEKDVIADVENIRQSVRYMLSTSRRWSGLLARQTFAKSIQGSNSIEGYLVSNEDALAAAAGQEPTTDPKHENWLAVSHYRNAMTYILQLAEDQHFTWDANLIRGLHYQMVAHDATRSPGRWRPGAIHVERAATGEVVYHAPAPEMVPPLINALMHSLSAEDSAPMVKGAMAHLNLVMIHPFRDGNGRMARALQTLVLVRAERILDPRFCSIEEHLGQVRDEYYAVLGEVGTGAWNPSRDARPFVRFCLRAHLHQAKRLLGFAGYMSYIWDEVEKLAKQHGFQERAKYALAEAASGYKVRNATYRQLAEVKEYLASRDLKELVDAGLLIAEGEKRGRAYVAADILKAIRQAAVKAYPPPQMIEDPFKPGPRRSHLT
jgi:Fic family protein